LDLDLLPLLMRANGLAVHAFRDPRVGLSRPDDNGTSRTVT
jgi:hypothetical protein